MHDYSWMYQVSSGGLRKIYYCNRVEGFIKYTLSNQKKILVDAVLDIHVRGVKIKNFLIQMLL